MPFCRSGVEWGTPPHPIVLSVGLPKPNSSASVVIIIQSGFSLLLPMSSSSSSSTQVVSVPQQHQAPWAWPSDQLTNQIHQLFTTARHSTPKWHERFQQWVLRAGMEAGFDVVATRLCFKPALLIRTFSNLSPESPARQHLKHYLLDNGAAPTSDVDGSLMELIQALSQLSSQMQAQVDAFETQQLEEEDKWESLSPKATPPNKRQRLHRVERISSAEAVAHQWVQLWLSCARLPQPTHEGNILKELIWTHEFLFYCTSDNRINTWMGAFRHEKQSETTRQSSHPHFYSNVKRALEPRPPALEANERETFVQKHLLRYRARTNNSAPVIPSLSWPLPLAVEFTQFLGRTMGRVAYPLSLSTLMTVWRRAMIDHLRLHGLSVCSDEELVTLSSALLEDPVFQSIWASDATRWVLALQPFRLVDQYVQCLEDWATRVEVRCYIDPPSTSGSTAPSLPLRLCHFTNGDLLKWNITHVGVVQSDVEVWLGLDPSYFRSYENISEVGRVQSDSRDIHSPFIDVVFEEGLRRLIREKPGPSASIVDWALVERWVTQTFAMANGPTPATSTLEEMRWRSLDVEVWKWKGKHALALSEERARQQSDVVSTPPSLTYTPQRDQWMPSKSSLMDDPFEALSVNTLVEWAESDQRAHRECVGGDDRTLPSWWNNESMHMHRQTTLLHASSILHQGAWQGSVVAEMDVLLSFLYTWNASFLYAWRADPAFDFMALSESKHVIWATVLLHWVTAQRLDWSGFRTTSREFSYSFLLTEFSKRWGFENPPNPQPNDDAGLGVRGDLQIPPPPMQQVIAEWQDSSWTEEWRLKPPPGATVCVIDSDVRSEYQMRRATFKTQLDRRLYGSLTDGEWLTIERGLELPDEHDSEDEDEEDEFAARCRQDNAHRDPVGHTTSISQWSRTDPTSVHQARLRIWQKAATLSFFKYRARAVLVNVLWNSNKMALMEERIDPGELTALRRYASNPLTVADVVQVSKTEHVSRLLDLKSKHGKAEEAPLSMALGMELDLPLRTEHRAYPLFQSEIQSLERHLMSFLFTATPIRSPVAYAFHFVRTFEMTELALTPAALADLLHLYMDTDALVLASPSIVATAFLLMWADKQGVGLSASPWRRLFPMAWAHPSSTSSTSTPHSPMSDSMQLWVQKAWDELQEARRPTDVLHWAVDDPVASTSLWTPEESFRGFQAQMEGVQLQRGWKEGSFPYLMAVHQMFMTMQANTEWADRYPSLIHTNLPIEPFASVRRVKYLPRPEALLPPRTRNLWWSNHQKLQREYRFDPILGYGTLSLFRVEQVHILTAPQPHVNQAVMVDVLQRIHLHATRYVTQVWVDALDVLYFVGLLGGGGGGGISKSPHAPKLEPDGPPGETKASGDLGIQEDLQVPRWSLLDPIVEELYRKEFSVVAPANGLFGYRETVTGEKVPSFFLNKEGMHAWMLTWKPSERGAGTLFDVWITWWNAEIRDQYMEYDSNLFALLPSYLALEEHV